MEKCRTDGKEAAYPALPALRRSGKRKRKTTPPSKSPSFNLKKVFPVICFEKGEGVQERLEEESYRARVEALKAAIGRRSAWRRCQQNLPASR